MLLETADTIVSQELIDETRAQLGLDKPFLVQYANWVVNACLLYTSVIAVCVDLGQPEDYDAVEKKAIKSGASKAYIVDAKEEFVKDYVWPTVKAGAVYEGKYLLGTSFARPLIGKILVDIAKKEGADAKMCIRDRAHAVRLSLVMLWQLLRGPPL